MSQTRLSLLVLILIQLALPPTPIAAHSSTQASPGVHLTRQLIVKFAVGIDPQVDVVARLPLLSQIAGHDLKYVRTISTGAVVLRLANPLDSADMSLVAQLLSSNALTLEIDYAESDRIIEPFFVPNDSNYSTQWNMQSVTSNVYGINLPGAWDLTTGSGSTVVAVVDSGIRPDHPEFAGRLLGGYDFIWDPLVSNDGNGQDADPSDPGDWVTTDEANTDAYRGCPVRSSSWHGTHVAGIIGATGNNGSGVAGINWQAKILPVRVLGKCGGYISDIADGILWAAGFPVLGVPLNLTPAKVINLSLGSPSACSSTEQLAITTANLLGATVVVAAGNNNANVSEQSPANCAGVIAVAATDRSGYKANYSNYGSQITISAPGGGGEGIYSTIGIGTQGPQGIGYGFKVGTSMAAAHVSGIVSLMLAVNPLMTPLQVPTLLRSTVTQFPTGSSCNPTLCGPGIVNAVAAVNAARPALGGVIGPIATLLPIGPILTTVPVLPIPILATSTQLPPFNPTSTSAAPSATAGPMPTATPTPLPTPFQQVSPTSSVTPIPTSTRPNNLNSTPSSTRAALNVPSFHMVGNQVEIRWLSAVGTKSTVSYGRQRGVYTAGVREVDYQQTHALILPDMIPGPLYYFTITQVDTSGHQDVTDELMIQMPALFSCYMPLLVQ